MVENINERNLTLTHVPVIPTNMHTRSSYVFYRGSLLQRSGRDPKWSANLYPLTTDAGWAKLKAKLNEMLDANPGSHKTVDQIVEVREVM